MTQALWGVLLLSLATGAPDGKLAGATARDIRPPAVDRPVTRASISAAPHTRSVKAARTTGDTSESYKAKAAK